MYVSLHAMYLHALTPVCARALLKPTAHPLALSSLAEASGSLFARACRMNSTTKRRSRVACDQVSPRTKLARLRERASKVTSQAIENVKEAERLEGAVLEEAARLETERLEKPALEKAALEEAALEEAALEEAAKLEAERLEAERLEAERLKEASAYIGNILDNMSLNDQDRFTTVVTTCLLDELNSKIDKQALFNKKMQEMLNELQGQINQFQEVQQKQTAEISEL